MQNVYNVLYGVYSLTQKCDCKYQARCMAMTSGKPGAGGRKELSEAFCVTYVVMHCHLRETVVSLG